MGAAVTMYILRVTEAAVALHISRDEGRKEGRQTGLRRFNIAITSVCLHLAVVQNEYYISVFGGSWR